MCHESRGFTVVIGILVSVLIGFVIGRGCGRVTPGLGLFLGAAALITGLVLVSRPGGGVGAAALISGGAATVLGLIAAG
jgi:hypothetical protein